MDEIMDQYKFVLILLKNDIQKYRTLLHGEMPWMPRNRIKNVI